MADPVTVRVLNTSSVGITLGDGHNDSVTVWPHHAPQSILFRFITWGMLPQGIRIIDYTMADGRVLTSLPNSDAATGAVISDQT